MIDIENQDSGDDFHSFWRDLNSYERIIISNDSFANFANASNRNFD